MATERVLHRKIDYSRLEPSGSTSIRFVKDNLSRKGKHFKQKPSIRPSIFFSVSCFLPRLSIHRSLLLWLILSMGLPTSSSTGSQ